MVTTSRLIVVLRSELGEQLKLACSEYRNIQDSLALLNDNPEKQKKLLESNRNKQYRLRTAAEALGRLTLGDIEDGQHNF